MHDNFTTKSPKNKWKSNHHRRQSRNQEIEEQYGYTATHGNQHPYLLDAPQEVLTHCTSYLEPQALLGLGRTCKRLREHVQDDNTWRRAFAYHFYELTPESGLDDSANGLMMRRTYRTWKKEYMSRFELQKRYEKSRTSTVAHFPCVSQVYAMRLLADGNSLLTASLRYGIVSRSRPINGKILKGYLTASSPHLGIGNPNVDFSPHVASLAIGPTASPNGAAVLWGFSSGEVALTGANKVMMDGAQAQTRYLRCRVEEDHPKPVVCTKVLTNEGLWATGDSAGKVKIWEGTPKKLRTVWETVSDGSNDSCVEIAGDIGTNSSGTLAIGFASGLVVLHTGLTVNLSEKPVNEMLTKNVVAVGKVPAEVRGDEPISRMTLAIDPNSTSDVVELLQCDYVARKSFLRLSVDLKSGPPRVNRSLYIFDSVGLILSITPSFTITQGEKSFVLAGDSTGFVHMWEWKKPLAEGTPTLEVSPSRSWPIYEDEGVSVIEVGEIVIATGSTRGRVTLHSTLNFARLRSFSPVNDRMLHNIERIILSDETLLWNVGSKVCCWRAGAVAQEAKGKIRTKGRHSPKVISKWIERAELKADLAESTKILEDQRRRNMKVQERMQSQNRVLNDLGLGESEALEYALMLSRETAQAEGSMRELPADEGVFVEDERLEENVVPPVDLDPTLDFEDVTSVAVPSGIPTGSLDENGQDDGPSVVDSGFPTLSSSSSSSPRRSSQSQSRSYSRSPTAWSQLGKGSASRTPSGPSSVQSQSSSSRVWEHRSVGGLDDLDEDLRYALELSLAEAESKRMGE